MSPKIITSHVFPPIPVRSFDWEAFFEGDEELGLRGHGATEEEAIADLLDTADQLAEDENDGQPDEAQEWHDFDPDC